MRRPSPGVIIGGSPIRVLRLTPAGVRMFDRWASGASVGPSTGAQALAGRLLDAGLAHPRPDPAHPAITVADVTVVIPVLDDRAGLADTLAALDGAGLGAILVIDDGSAKPIEAFELPAGVELIRRDFTGGPGAARNTGWRNAIGPVVVFIDANCIPPQGWIEVLLAHFADPAVAAVAPRVVSRSTSGSPTLLAAYEGCRSPLDLGGREAPVAPGGRVPYVPTAALAVRTEALRGVDGFDESMRFGEDVDLVWRLGKDGWRIRYEPGVSVSHPIRSSYRTWMIQRHQYGRSAADLAVRHGRDVAPLASSPWSCAAWTVLLAGSPAGAATLSLASAMALAKRAGGDRATAVELSKLVLRGNIDSGRSIAIAIRRAWLPLLVLMVSLSGGRLSALRPRLAATAAAALLADPAVEWACERPPIGLSAWIALRLADDLAYQSGVWRGVVARRSGGALLPRW